MLGDHHIGEGGLLRRLESATKLTSLRAQVGIVVVFLWLPVVVLAVAREQTAGIREPLLYDAGFHVRLLLAAPIFLWLDNVFPRICRLALSQLQSQGFVPDHALPRVDRLVRTASRVADSMVPEAVLASLGVGLGVMALLGNVHLFGVGPVGTRSPAQVWYALADLPLFQFLLWRSLWRWLIWSGILLGLSRVDLDLVATHPDRRGGLSFLRVPSLAYCAVLLFAVSGVLCAEWGRRFTFGQTLESFTPILILFGAVGSVLAFGPLLAFAPQLFWARFWGVLEVGGLASRQGRLFRERWIVDAPVAREKKPLMRSEMQGIADMTKAYRETVERLSPFLFDVRDTALLLAATLLPVLPVMLFYIPREDWLTLVGMFSGGWAR